MYKFHLLMTPEALKQAQEPVPQKKDIKINESSQKSNVIKKAKFYKISKITDKVQTAESERQNVQETKLIEFTSENTPFPFVDIGPSDKSKKITHDDLLYTCVVITRAGKGFKGTANVLETPDEEFADDIADVLDSYGWDVSVLYSYITGKATIRMSFPHPDS